MVAVTDEGGGIEVRRVRLHHLDDRLREVVDATAHRLDREGGREGEGRPAVGAAHDARSASIASS